VNTTDRHRTTARPSSRANGPFRLADLLAALSLETDLGMGHPPEEAIRTCLLATGLGRRIDLSQSELADVYWTALLMHVGCTAFAHEQAAIFGGDEIAVNAIGSKTDFGSPREAIAFLLELGKHTSPLQRARILFVGLARGERFGREVATATCEVAAAMAPRLGLSGRVQDALRQLFERWDGKGAPQQLDGEAIALPARLAQLAAQAMVYHRLGGLDAVLAIVRRRSGTALDPRLVEALVRHGPGLLRNLDACDPWRAVIEAEPSPQRWISDAQIDEIARAFGDAVDLKSPFLLGHSAGVAALAEGAARQLQLPDADVTCVRRAALFHDLGRVGVANGVWEKAGPLTAGEWAQVRLHAYHSERILSCSPVLAALAPVAGMHHERLDGSGYHRQATASGIPMPARVLAAADAFQAMCQVRPHRAAFSTAAAAAELHAQAKAGRLDRRAVDAVLAAAGERRKHPVRHNWPASLTDREVEVLRLLARGFRTRDLARRLCISAKTAGHHIEHIYQKLGVSSRAAATMFAAHHDLLS
jgi:HD-GYP domain-containing protein (c-di-GMP phosphodiesterase class II)